MSTICRVESATGITSLNIVLYESCIHDWNSGNRAEGTPARVASETRYSPLPREISERRLSYDDAVNRCRRFFARAGARLASPGVVLEVTSDNGSVRSDTAALVPLVRSDIASVGAVVSSVVASVTQPDVIHKTPKHRTARQCVLLKKSSDPKTLATAYLFAHSDTPGKTPMNRRCGMKSCAECLKTQR